MKALSEYVEEALKWLSDCQKEYLEPAKRVKWPIQTLSEVDGFTPRVHAIQTHFTNSAEDAFDLKILVSRLSQMQQVLEGAGFIKEKNLNFTPVDSGVPKGNSKVIFEMNLNGFLLKLASSNPVPNIFTSQKIPFFCKCEHI